MCCLKCGGYAWSGVMTLTGRCTGQPRSKDLKRQRTRFLDGLFPAWNKQYAGWTVDGHSSPSPSDLLALIRSAHKGVQVTGMGCPGAAANFVDCLWEEKWSLAQLLSRSGMILPALQSVRE